MGFVSGRGVKGKRKGGGHASRYREVPSASLTNVEERGPGGLRAPPFFNFYINLVEGADAVVCLYVSQPIPMYWVLYVHTYIHTQ